jgi:hypothetical protein
MKAKCIFLQSAVRSGTTYLGNCLSNHPGIGVFREIFYPTLRDDKGRNGAWFAWYSEQLKTNPELVFPAKQQQIFPIFLDFLCDQYPNLPVFLDLKLEQLDWGTHSLKVAIYRPEHSFVIMRRKNVLKLVVSNLLMNQRLDEGDRSIHRSYVPEKKSLRVNPEQLVRQIHDKIGLVERYAKWAKNCGAPVFELDYETLVGEEHDEIMARIQEFIGVEVKQLRSDLVKQNPYPLAELIENYGEVRRCLIAAKLDYMLELPS